MPCFIHSFPHALIVYYYHFPGMTGALATGIDVFHTLAAASIPTYVCYLTNRSRDTFPFVVHRLNSNNCYYVIIVWYEVHRL
jgi:hypothetical protein